MYQIQTYSDYDYCYAQLLIVLLRIVLVVLGLLKRQTFQESLCCLVRRSKSIPISKKYFEKCTNYIFLVLQMYRIQSAAATAAEPSKIFILASASQRVILLVI